MSIPTTWTELKAELASLIIRDDLTDLIPNFIGYAENWMQREIFSPEREDSATLTITNGSAPLPADYAGLKTVFVDGSVDQPLSPLTPDELRGRYPTVNTGTPFHFAIEGENMLFGPWPTSGTSVVLKYIEGIPKLGAMQATNWLLTDHPDLYVNASMAEAFEYARDWDAGNRRRTAASAIADSVLRAGRRRKTNSGPLAATSPVRQVSRYARA